jgi:dipeptidyl aminopeptidase/acylaminoacyl peptidase
VPPSQAELIVAALRERGLPHAYLLFEGEGHGFREAKTMIQARNVELSFYAQILGFEPAGDIPRLAIENLPSR